MLRIYRYVYIDMYVGRLKITTSESILFTLLSASSQLLQVDDITRCLLYTRCFSQDKNTAEEKFAESGFLNLILKNQKYLEKLFVSAFYIFFIIIFSESLIS